MVPGRKVLVPVETQQVGTIQLDTFYFYKTFSKTFVVLRTPVTISVSKTKLFTYREKFQARFWVGKNLRVGGGKKVSLVNRNYTQNTVP